MYMVISTFRAEAMTDLGVQFHKPTGGSDIQTGSQMSKEIIQYCTLQSLAC